MTVVSPHNPNLCLGCEQLAEDDSAELERLLLAALQSTRPWQITPGLAAHQFSSDPTEQVHPSETKLDEQPIFFSPV